MNLQPSRLISGRRSPLQICLGPPPPRHRLKLDKFPRQSILMCTSRQKTWQINFKPQASNVNVRDGGYGESMEGEKINKRINDSEKRSSFVPDKFFSASRSLLYVSAVLLVCILIYSLIAFSKGDISRHVSTLAKSGFTAAFTLIFVSEIGDKTFFIAALLAMQFDKALVLLGSMGALSLMTILSVVIGRIFQSVPSQFQTTLPIGEYAAVGLLTFFGLKSIKDAWELRTVPADGGGSTESPGLGELVEAEELVKEKVGKKLTNPLEIIWKSFSLVFFAEWGDRSMLATIALGAAQSPWEVAGGAIAGHLMATSIAAIGGSFLAKYISEKLVGYLGGVLFLIFAVATLLGIF